MLARPAARTAASNGSSCSSCSSRVPTWTGAWFSPPSASPCPTMCLPVASTPSTTSGPWSPRTYAQPSSAARYGSSPYVSSMRPQRGSRVMSRTGPSACRAPVASIRRRSVVAICSTRSASHVAAAPMDCWNEGASRASRPWRVSSWKIAGIPSLVSSTRNRWTSLPAAATPNASRFVPPAIRVTWPIPAPEQRARAVEVERALADDLERPDRPELRGLLLDRHPCEQVLDARVDGQLEVPVRRLGHCHQPFTAPAVRPPTSCRSAKA